MAWTEVLDTSRLQAERVPMNPPPEETGNANKILNYRSPERGRASDRYVIVACALVFAWFIAMGLAGVASDFTRIPLPKKIALTVASIAVAAIIIRTSAGRNRGCVILVMLYIFFAAMEVGVMWFWN
jgi:hypothetical protein